MQIAHSTKFRGIIWTAALAMLASCSVQSKLGLGGDEAKADEPPPNEERAEADEAQREEQYRTRRKGETFQEQRERVKRDMDAKNESSAERRAREAEEKRLKNNRDAAARRAAFRDMVEIEPTAGIDRVSGPVAIDWCGELEPIPNGAALKRQMRQVRDKGVWASESAAALLCGMPDDPDYEKQAGYWVQAWMNATGLPQKEVIAHLRLRAKPSWKSMKQEHCSALKASSEDSKLEKKRVSALRWATGCASSARPLSVLRPAFDVGEEPNEAVRAAFLLQWLGNDGLEQPDDRALLRWAKVSYEAGRLSRKRLDAWIRSEKLNAYAAANARESLGAAIAVAERYRAHAKAKAKSDPAWKTLLVDAPRRAVAAWKKTTGPHAAALKQAAAYEAIYDGPSKKANRGCDTKLRGLVGAHLKRARPKDAASARDALTDPVGALLLARLAGCEHQLGIDGIAGKHGELALEARWLPGPRAAIDIGLAQALAEIKSDRTRFPLSPKDVGASAFSRLAQQAKSYANVGEVETGVVEKVIDKGDMVHIRFKTERWKEPNYRCKSTGQIWKIEPGGTVKYHEDCVIIGTRWEHKTHKPIRVKKPYATGIRRGSFVKFGTSITKWKNGAALGVILEGYRSKKQKKLVNFYGFGL